MGSPVCDQWTDSGFTDGSLNEPAYSSAAQDTLSELQKEIQKQDFYHLKTVYVRSLFDEFGLPAISAKTVNRILNDLNSIYVDQTIFEVAIQSVPLGKRMAGDMILKLVEKAFQNSKTPESYVLDLGNIFISIGQAMVRDGKTVDISLLFSQLKSAFKGRMPEMIAKIGGSFKCPPERALTMRPVTECLLRHGEHFMVLFCETSLNKEMNTFLDKVVSTWSKHDGRRRAMFLCGHHSFSTKLEEIKFYTRFSNAVFVPFVAADNAVNKGTLACFEEMSSADENIVIPVPVLGLTSVDLPLCLQKYNSLDAFPSLPWEQAEMQNFICRLHASFEENMLLELTPKARGQFEIKLTVNIQNDEDRSIIVQIKEGIQALMEDPWSQVRRHMLHVYKLKNVRVFNVPDENRLLVEILLKKASEMQAILVDYRKGQLEVMFNKQLKLTEINRRYFCTINIDEARVESLCDISQRAVSTVKVVETYSAGVRRKQKFFSLSSPYRTKTTNDNGILRKVQITAAVVTEMVCKTSNYRPYDVFRKLVNKADEIQLADIKNEADHNLLHIIVAAARPEYFPVVFYLNLWDELRLQLTNSGNNPQCGGYTPRGLAEKLLYQEGGPETLEQYDCFDKLWLDLPLLHKACLRGSLEHVELLLSKEHDIHKKDSSGATCILYACATGSVHVVRYLLDRGVNPNLANVMRENGFILAAKYGQVAVIDLLLSRCDFNQKDCDEQNYRALDYVAKNGDFPILKAFTDNNIQPDERMVSLAAKCDNFEVVQHLINKYGLKGTGLDENGLTAFLHAAANGNINMLAFLIENEVDVMVADIQNQNCLHLVAEFNQPKACQYLIAAYKEKGNLQDLINIRNFYSGKDHLKLVRGRENGRPVWKYVAVTRTMRHEFEKKVESGHIDVEKFGKILSSGFGRKPSKEILKQHDELALDKIKQCLLDRTSLMIAVWKGNREVAMQLLAVGADPSMTDYFGSTPLHMAAMTGDLQLVRELETRGVKVSLKNNEGKTAADVASENGHQTVLNFLEGAKYFEHAKTFLECLVKVKKKLSDDVLNTMRSEGTDIRRYAIEIARDLKIDVNKVLLGLGSGPVMEESCNTQGLKPHDFKSEFAGNQ